MEEAAASQSSADGHRLQRDVLSVPSAIDLAATWREVLGSANMLSILETTSEVQVTPIASERVIA
jgi:hypothetical protein